MKKRAILVTCAKGIAPYLKAELAALGLPICSESIAGIGTEGGVKDIMRMNLLLRTAHRVLSVIKEFPAKDPAALYRAIRDIAWEDLVPADGYLCVTSGVDTPAIRDGRYASLKCKDAIVDRIKERTGRRPDAGPERDRSVVHLYWKDDRATVYLDMSGETLTRRGYRKIPMTAPMQETLAAAVVTASGWQGADAFLNPFCGSGTLAIEAALIGLKRAPGLLRSNFGLLHVPGIGRVAWDRLREEARKASLRALPGRIIATDIDGRAVEAARRNARTAGVDRHIEFSVCDFAETAVPAGGGVVVMNPEYGERLGDARKLEGVYERIGDFLKQRCTGYRGYVFTGNLALAKKIGLRAKRRIPFWNSGIECRLLEYDLYTGTRRKRNED